MTFFFESFWKHIPSIASFPFISQDSWQTPFLRYKISEELGQSHQESSFYQALHDGTVKGTCMILDEKAQGKNRRDQTGPKKGIWAWAWGDSGDIALQKSSGDVALFTSKLFLFACPISPQIHVVFFSGSHRKGSHLMRQCH